MTDLPGGYAPTESFESSPATAVAADRERVVVGTESGTVEIVSADDRTTVELDAPITDVAVGNRVYALAGTTIAALSTGGTRVWSVERPEAKKLAALPQADVLGVVADDSFVGFDGETGGQEFAVERPYADVTDDPGFFGADGAFVLVAWSFLAVRNVDGSERFDLNLDGAIESAGIVDDTIVVSLKDERVVGIHALEGQKQWERELAVTDLPDRGDDALLFTADGELVTLTADGTYSTVEDLPGGDVYPTSKGDLFCAITDGTVAVYCATGDPVESLSVGIADAELVPGVTDDLALELRNDGDRHVTTSLRADGEGVAVSETDPAVDLAPGESATQTLRVEEITADDSAAIAIEAEGDHLASVSLSVVSRDEGSVSAEATLDSVTDGVAKFGVEVENDGETPLTGVSVSPGDARVGRLAPGESATVTVETPFERGTVVPVRVEAEETDAELDATVPHDGCSVGVETTDGFVDVRVENGTDARLADELVVEGNCVEGRIGRRVEVPAGSAFVLALAPDDVPQTVTVDASLAGAGVTQSAQFPASDFGSGGRKTGQGGRETGRGTGQTGRRTGQRTEQAGRETGRRADQSRDARPGQSGRGTRPDSGDRDTRETTRDAPGETGRDGSPSRASANQSVRFEESDAANTSPSGADSHGSDSSETVGTGAATGPDLDVDRGIDHDEPVRTQRVRERIEVSNAGDDRARDVELDVGDESFAVGDLPAGERVRIERQHVVTETGTVTLPGGRVIAENADGASVPARDVDVDREDFGADVTLEPTDGAYRVRATFSNRRSVACEVSRIGIAEVGKARTGGLRVPPGETVEWTQRVESAGASATPVKAAIEYAFEGEPSEKLDTLARLRDASAGGSAGLDGLDVTIGDETNISGGYGSVSLVVENRGEAPLADVSVEATGEAVSDLMYTGRETLGDLAPGDRFTHFVDVETEGPEAEISVALEADGDEAELTLGGPAPADESDWSERAREAWSAERAASDGGAETTHVVTDFEQV